MAVPTSIAEIITKNLTDIIPNNSKLINAQKLQDLLSGVNKYLFGVNSNESSSVNPFTSDRKVPQETYNIAFSSASNNLLKITPKGVVGFPIATTQRDALAGIEEGTFIYNSTNKRYEYYDNVSWKPFSSGSGSTISGSTGYLDGNIDS